MNRINRIFFSILCLLCFSNLYSMKKFIKKYCCCCACKHGTEEQAQSFMELLQQHFSTEEIRKLDELLKEIQKAANKISKSEKKKKLKKIKSQLEKLRKKIKNEQDH